jgi:hypothetical protein
MATTRSGSVGGEEGKGAKCSLRPGQAVETTLGRPALPAHHGTIWPCWSRWEPVARAGLWTNVRTKLAAASSGVLAAVGVGVEAGSSRTKPLLVSGIGRFGGDGISGGRLTREKKGGREEDWTERRWRG